MSARVSPVAEPRQPLLVRYGNFMFRWRNTIFPVVLLALFFAFRPVWPAGGERRDNLLDAAGFLIALAGQLLRIAVIGYVYIIRGGRNQRVYAEDLVTSGFFAHSRNPLYVGNLLVLLGLFLIHGNPWAIALGGAFFLLAYRAIVAAEEAYLRQKFGAAYDAYRRDVPRWLPRLGGLRQSLAGMRFNWRRVVSKEYTSTYVWMGGALILMAADTLVHHPYDSRADYLNALWAGLLVLTVAWGVARYLKKTKRLRSGASPERRR